MTANTLPIIDISPFLRPSNRSKNDDELMLTAIHISKACQEHGFFYLKGHGIPSSKTNKVLSLARRFFTAGSDSSAADAVSLSSPSTQDTTFRTHGTEIKRRIQRYDVAAGGDGARGYQRIGENITQGRRDWHEAVDWYAEWGGAGEEQVKGQDELCTGENLWPEKPAELREVFEDYVECMKVVGTAVVRAMGWGLGLPELSSAAAAGSNSEKGDVVGEESREVFVENTKDSFWVMRMIGYPPLPSSKDGDHPSCEDNVEQFSCGTHTDYGCVTLLLADETPHALQVQSKDGSWIYADPIPEAYVVNIGDMMERWTNGLWRSTRHRVIHRGNNYRVSVPFFFEPNWNARVKPLKKCIQESGGKVGDGGIEPVHYGEHLISKIKGNFY
jgi:isopenicillin N synthase-like dioxygenase